VLKKQTALTNNLTLACGIFFVKMPFIALSSRKSAFQREALLVRQTRLVKYPGQA
jgi:hypothetical protein